jgi:hypothetical protein
MLNIDHLRLTIEGLIRDYPELAEDEILRLDMLEGTTDFKEILTELFRRADDGKMLADAVTLRIDELTERRARFVRRVEAMRELMLRALQSANLKRVELAEATISQRTPPPQIVGDPDANTLPDEFVRIRREPNRTAIREALMAGREVAGCFLSNSPPGLLVKSK